MRDLFPILLFSFLVLLGYPAFVNFGIPLVVPAPPPVEEKISGNITMDQYVAIGKKIFHGKGTCTLCHNPTGHRAPLLDVAGSDGPPVGVRADERVKDPNYHGGATTGEEYILESMKDPSAFVVPHYGKTGTNDTVSPMPTINKGAIGLSDVEMGAVAAFLQSVAGVDITVPLPTGEAPAASEGDGEEVKPAANAKEAFDKFGCSACHMHPLIDEGGDIGPNLGKVGATAGSRVVGLTAKQFIEQSIIKPNAVIHKGFEPDTMPQDFADSMTVSELHMLVDAILHPNKKPDQEPKKTEGE